MKWRFVLTFWVKKSWNQEFGFKKYGIQDFGLLLDFSILESWIEDFGWLLDFSVPKSWIEDYNIRVALTLRRLLTNVKYKDKPEDRQRALYKIKCCDCQAFTLVKPAETEARDWPNTNERRGMVTSTITLLSTI